ncbi:MAG TPA: hypothetical protein P5191_07115 [Ruminococcus sp.]|nr:hypothetical protein [Ruminococcus sp.]
MKKLLATLCALTLTLSLAACGDKDSSSEKTSSKSSSSSSEKKYNENDDDDNSVSTDDERNSEISADEEAEAFEKLSGSYYMTGYGTSGEVSGKFEDMYVYQDAINEEGVTISKDGVLHIEGEDYQLLAQKIEDEKMIFSIKGSGFSLQDYEKKYRCASKDYEGFAVLEYTSQPITSDFEVMDSNGNVIDAYINISLSYSQKGSTSSNVSISLDTDKPEKNYQDPLTDDEKAEALKAIAGSYEFSYGMNNTSDCSIERYADASSDEVRKIFEDDPVTISEDGVLHFDGKDYQLEPQEFGDNKGLFSVEGCGFSMKEYKHGIGLDVSSKEYSGAAIVKYSVSSFSFGDDTTIIPSISVYVTDSTSESAQVSFDFERED